MCNLYAIMRARAEAARLARAMVDRNNNQPPSKGIFPDYPAPIVRNTAEGREMVDLRWGMPSSSQALFKAATTRADKLRATGNDVDFAELLKHEPDGGTTNVRNTTSKHWTRWLGPDNRCLVPFTSFAEPNDANRSENVWFAGGEDRPVMFFAGIWTNWTSVRKIKEGMVTCDLFAFLTTEPNTEVGQVHSKAMPVILASEDDRELWLSDRPWSEVAHLQRPLPDGSLKVVARGVGLRSDETIPA